MLKNFLLIFIILISEFFLGKINSIENPLLRYLSDKINLKDLELGVGEFIKGRFIQKSKKFIKLLNQEKNFINNFNV